jgi:hypothetical protein
MADTEGKRKSSRRCCRDCGANLDKVSPDLDPSNHLAPMVPDHIWAKLSGAANFLCGACFLAAFENTFTRLPAARDLLECPFNYAPFFPWFEFVEWLQHSPEHERRAVSEP